MTAEPGQPESPAGGPAPLPQRALETSAERPWPLRLLSSKMADYIGKMAPVWVEGQIVEANRRAGMSFFTLRDNDADMSLRLTAYSQVLDRVSTPLTPGTHVVVHAKPAFYAKRGDLSLQARDIKPVGLGELLARIEELRRVLAAEGLFNADRKQPLPFLPTCIGLVCGREAKAMDDVLVNARERFPEVQFEVRQVAVQGVKAVAEVSRAVKELDAHPAVEDLLPFSNEALVRVVAGCTTPIVSAIGHETDAPLLDLVADYRASTPTDAAKRVVPDVVAERTGIDLARRRLGQAIQARLRSEQDRLTALRSRPVLAHPDVMVSTREESLERSVTTMRLHLGTRLDRAGADIASLASHVRALSPAATLQRGYAVVRTPGGAIVRDATTVAPGDPLEAIVAEGRFLVAVAPTTATRGAGTTTSRPSARTTSPAPSEQADTGPALVD